MSPTECLGVSWQCLIDRVESAVRLAVWACSEPALDGIASLDELARVVHRSGDLGRCDDLLGALVRIAAVDGGDEEDAALLVAHLLSNGTRQLAIQLRDLSPDIDGLIAGELWLQIRGFPWRRRTRAYAKSLLLDTRMAVVAELCPYRSRAGETRVFLADQAVPEAGSAISPCISEGSTVEAHDRDELRLVDVLEWAHRSGTLTPDDIGLLLDLVAAGDAIDDGSGMARRGVNTTAEVLAVAARRGVATKTIRRHRDRALFALREVSDLYLDAVA